MLHFIVGLDNGIENYLISVNQPYLERFFYSITQFGSGIIAAAVVLALIYWLWRRDPKLLKVFIPVFLLSESAVYIMKHLFGRLRPLGALKYGEFDASLPSGHAAFSILVYGYICYLILKHNEKSPSRDLAVALLGLLVLLIGFSRLYLDVHYFSDVLTGYIIGGTALFYSVKFSDKFKRK